jgi:cellobiose phosphorylase
VLEHLERALAFTRENQGAHGLPLLGFADWNDTVNLPAGAESLFTAHLYGRALKVMIELSEFTGSSQKAGTLQAEFDEMQARVNQTAWDGEWYLRYFDADGQPLGSKQNTQGQIYINAQSWAVLSGFASREQGLKAMDSVFNRLNTRYGIKLSAPGFNGFDPKVGGITTYPPGAKENGGIFLHTNPWAMIAETLLGRGERAYQYYCQINPALRNELIEIYECEPYVYPQNILGDEHPQFGLARNSWLSGTASWVYQAATQYILGVRASYSGLIVDPCLPPEWETVEVFRKFRGADYHLVIHNPRRVCSGVKQMEVNGCLLEGNLIPLAQPGEQVEVKAWLG